MARSCWILTALVLSLWIQLLLVHVADVSVAATDVQSFDGSGFGLFGNDASYQEDVQPAKTQKPSMKDVLDREMAALEALQKHVSLLQAEKETSQKTLTTFSKDVGQMESMLYMFLGSFVGSNCAVPSLAGEDRRAVNGRDTLTMATFNVESLTISQFDECPGSKCTWKNKIEAIQHVYDIAMAIRKIDADIVNLVEVMGCDVLNLLLHFVGPSYGYHAYFVDSGDSLGQGTGMLTRIDPASTPVDNIKPQAGAESPKNHTVNFVVKNESGHEKTFTIIVVHLLSRLHHANTPKRMKQAEHVAAEIKGYIKHGHGVIVTGDFNDYVSPTKQTKTSIDVVKEALGPGSVDLVDNVELSQRYSHEFKQTKMLLDHMIVTGNLASVASKETFWHEAVDQKHSLNQRVSDHAPFSVRLNIA